MPVQLGFLPPEQRTWSLWRGTTLCDPRAGSPLLAMPDEMALLTSARRSDFVVRPEVPRPAELRAAKAPRDPRAVR
jgi:hypothetical protein